MGERRVLASLILTLVVSVCVFPPLSAGPAELQSAIRAKLLSSLPPDRQKTVPPTSPVDQIIAVLDGSQRQAAVEKLKPLESQFPDPKGLREIGEVYLKLGSPIEAGRVAGVIKANHPNSAEGPLLEAKAKSESGDAAGALSAARAAVALDSTNSEALSLAMLLRNGQSRAPSRIPIAAPSQGSSGPASRNRGTLDDPQRTRVNKALADLQRSANGRRIIIAIVPGSNGNVTESDLRDNGVDLVAKQEPLQGRDFGAVTQTTDARGATVYVITVNNAVIAEGNDSREVAAFLGGKLDQVAQKKKEGESQSPVMVNWRENVAQAFILIDLGVPAFANGGNTLFSQDLRLNARVYQGNLTLKPLDASVGEYYGDRSEFWFQTVASSESNFGGGIFENLLRLTCAESPSLAAGLTPQKKADFAASLSRDFQPK